MLKENFAETDGMTGSWFVVVRFSDSLALGSESGIQYPYRRVIFLSTLPARKNSKWTWEMGSLLDIFSSSQVCPCPVTISFTHWSRRASGLGT